jgi:ubiquitin carboxyl-terminal hydrolase 34
MAGHDAVLVNSTGQQLRSPKAPSSEPSLPRRDSIDGDDSLTRKRPRLDSGSRSKSADRALSASNQAAQEQDRSFLVEGNQETGVNQDAPANMTQAKQTPNKVTINIRNPQQVPNGDTNSGMPVEADLRRDSHVSPALGTLIKEDCDSDTKVYPNVPNGAESPVLVCSSPEIEIEIGLPEDLDDDPTAVDIRIDGMEADMVPLMLEKFPYAVDGDWIKGAKAYYDHLETGMSHRFQSLRLLIIS